MKPQDAIPIDPVEFTFAVELMSNAVPGRQHWKKIEVLHLRGKPVLVPWAACVMIKPILEGYAWDLKTFMSFCYRAVAHAHLLHSKALDKQFPNHDRTRVHGAALELCANWPLTPRGRFDQTKLLPALGALLGSQSTIHKPRRPGRS